MKNWFLLVKELPYLKWILVGLLVVAVVIGISRATSATNTKKVSTPVVTARQDQPSSEQPAVKQGKPSSTDKSASELQCGLIYLNDGVYGPAVDYPNEGQSDQVRTYCGKQYKWLNAGQDHYQSSTPGAAPDIGNNAQTQTPYTWPESTDYNSAPSCPGTDTADFPYKKLGTGLTLDLTPTSIAGFKGMKLHILPTTTSSSKYTFGLDAMYSDFLERTLKVGFEPPMAMSMDFGVGDEKLMSTYHFGDISSALCNGEMYVLVTLYPAFETARWQQ